MAYLKQKCSVDFRGFKRFGLLFLCLCITVSGIPIHAFAADTVPLKFSNTGDENYQSGDYTAPEKTAEYATSVTFDALVDHDSNTSISYQWYACNDQNSIFTEVDGETAPQLTIPSIGVDTPTAYKCIVSDGNQTVEYKGSVLKNTSLRFNIEEGNNGSITTILGKTCSIDATATTNQGLDITYKWYKNDILIEGGSLGILTFEKYQIADNGDYRCEVSDGIETQNYSITLNSESDLAFVAKETGFFYPDYGSDLTIEAAATNNSGSSVTYQWYAYNSETGKYEIMSGETGNKLALVFIIRNTASNYKCVITDGIKSLIYKAHVRPEAELAFKYPWKNSKEIYTALGSAYTIDATAITNPGLAITYQWYKNNVKMEGETSPILSIENYQVEDNGSYSCDVRNTVSSIKYYCKFNCYKGLSLVNDRTYESIHTAYGGDAILDVTATTDVGNDITYQWYVHNRKIGAYDKLTEETASQLSLTNVGAETPTSYRCVISDGVSTFTYYGHIYIDTNLKFVNQLDNKTQTINTNLGETCTLSGLATSSVSEHITYRWYKGYITPIEGCDKADFTIENYGISDNDMYLCQASDGVNTITVYFDLFGYSELAFVGNNKDEFTIEYGAEKVLDATAKSDQGNVVTYQWYCRYPKNFNSSMDGETGPKLKLSAEQLNISRSYLCVVKDGVNEINYVGVILFDTGLKFTNVEGTSANIYMKEGDEVCIHALATSNITQDITYQWYRSGYYLLGYNTNTFTVDQFQAAEDSADYYCTASDGVNTIKYEVNLIANEVNNVSLNKTSLSLDKGDSYTLTATLTPSNVQADVKWNSSNTKVATVDANGIVTAKEPGKAIITAQVGSVVSQESTVTVNQKYTVKFVNYDNKAIYTCTVNRGETPVAPAVPNRKGYTFKGWDKTFNNVTGNIVVKAVFSENLPSSIKLNATKKSLKVKKKFALVSKVLPAIANNKTVTYHSSNKKIATVNAKGVVTGIEAGAVTITAKTVNGKTATCKVRITKDPKSIKLNAKTKSLKKGKKFQLKVTLSKGATSKIKFKSSKESVATVSSKGKIKAIKKGTAVITATTANGKSASIKITVKNKKRRR